MEKEKAIDRIKKLLRMKRGGTSAEVETALQLAQKIAAEHDIDLNSVDPTDESKFEPIQEENVFVANGIPLECKYSGMICQQFFNIRVILISRYLEIRTFTYKKVIRFVGTASDIEIGKYIYNFLYKHFRREWKNKRGRLRNRESFMYGIYLGIASKLKPEVDKTINEPGLVLRKSRIDKYMDNKHSKMKTVDLKPDRCADAALRKGFQAGVDTEIRKAVKTETQTLQLNS